MGGPKIVSLDEEPDSGCIAISPERVLFSLFGTAGAPRVLLPERAARPPTNNTPLNSRGGRFQGSMTAFPTWG